MSVSSADEPSPVSLGMHATRADFDSSKPIDSVLDEPERISQSGSVALTPSRRRSSSTSSNEAVSDANRNDRNLANLKLFKEETLDEEKDFEVNDIVASENPNKVVDAESTLKETKVKVNIGPQHFDLLKLIGEGAFGKVILVRNKLNSELYAMKVITKKLLKRKNHFSYMKSERDILTRVKHPFIVTLAFAFQTEQRLFLVMDFLGGGELFFHLRRRGLIMEKEARIYFAEMVLAIEFLHNMGVVHRDLKPENVLLHSDGHICITDFGLAKEVGDNAQVRTLCGTSEYMAPEMLLRNGYTKAVDWWSLGTLFYEMLCGKPPFQLKKGESLKDLDRKIISDKFTLPPYLQVNTVSLLKGMLEKDMNKRLGSEKSTMFRTGGVTALKDHAFFEEIVWSDVYNCKYEPPIDLSQAYAKPGTTPGGGSAIATPVKSVAPPANGAKGKKKANDKEKVGIHNGVVGENTSSSPDNTQKNTEQDIIASSLRHFHEDFTQQQISPSVVEDALSEASTPCDTPQRSRANSGIVGGTNMSADEAFADFGYTEPSFECTMEQVERFQQDLTEKLAKAEAKKRAKAKKEAKKALEAEAARLIEVEKKAKADAAEALSRARSLEEATKAQQQDRLRALQQRLDRAEHLRTEINASQKRLKTNNKKLRDIIDLQLRIENGTVSSPSVEQKQKVAKRTAFEDTCEKEKQGLVELEKSLQICLLDENDQKELLELKSLLSTSSEARGGVPDKETTPSEAHANVLECVSEVGREEDSKENSGIFETHKSSADMIGQSSDIETEKYVEKSALPTQAPPPPAGKYIPVHLRRQIAGEEGSDRASLAPRIPPNESRIPTWGTPLEGSTPLAAFEANRNQKSWTQSAPLNVSKSATSAPSLSIGAPEFKPAWLNRDSHSMEGSWRNGSQVASKASNSDEVSIEKTTSSTVVVTDDPFPVLGTQPAPAKPTNTWASLLKK